MEKFTAFMDKYILPYATKLGAQRHLVAVRDAFIAMIPLTIIGSFATLINNMPFKALSNFLAENTFGQQIKTINGDIWWGTLAIMALLLVIGVAYNLAKSYEENGLQAAMIATAIFFFLAPQVASITPEGATEAVVGWGFMQISYLGTTALFTAIIVGLLATELCVKLGKVKALVIKMPDAVPPAVSRSFAKLIPGMLTVLIFAVIGLIVRTVADGAFLTDLINKYVGIPLSGVTDSLGGAIAITLFIHGLWFVGLHGSNIALPITSTLLTKLGADNAQIMATGSSEPLHTLAGPFFDAFVHMGGAGLIIGLLVAIAIAGRSRKDMLALGTAPAIFNINEPVIFGLPIVLNPIYGILFIIAPVVTTIVSYLSIKSGLVSPVIVASMPWTTPPIISGFLATGHISGAILALVNIIISIVIYLPFVYAAERMEAKKYAE